MDHLDWDDLRFVLALSRDRSLAGAAKALRVNETTVARRLTRLETALGLKIFQRAAGVGWRATEAGQRVVLAAEQMDAGLLAARSELDGSHLQVAGQVRLTAVPVVVNHMLIPALSGLMQRHPALSVDLIADNRSLNLTKREADVAVRLARPLGEQQVLARRIADFTYAAYVASGMDPATPTWVDYSDRMADLPQARWLRHYREAHGGRSEALDLAPVTVNDAEALIACARAGLGKVILPTRVGDADPALIRADDDTSALTREVWLLVHPDQRSLPRIQAVMDWVEDVFGE